MSLWVLKSVSDQDKASITIESYGDSLTEYYNYDNNVANSKNIKAKDYAIIIDKKRILGFSKIGFIDRYEGSKNIRRCPECQGTNITVRKNKLPKYRCNIGHEFEAPIEETQIVTKYSASYEIFIPIGSYNNDLNILKPYYINTYNRNMSMQKLDIVALNQFEDIYEKFSKVKDRLNSSESFLKESENPYQNNGKDDREAILRSIKARRGQQTFRKNLLETYQSTCVITGCKIIDILEAAHINPYRGENDNHVSNGLLLRADIHTLFDLDLIRIHPDDYTVEINEKLIGSEYEQYDGLSLIDYKNLISKEALIIKYEQINKGG